MVQPHAPCEGTSNARCPAHRVPYLQLNLLAINVDHSSTKLHANSEVVDRLEPLVSELQEKAGLSNPCTYDNRSIVSSKSTTLPYVVLPTHHC